MEQYRALGVGNPQAAVGYTDPFRDGPILQPLRRPEAVQDRLQTRRAYVDGQQTMCLLVGHPHTSFRALLEPRLVPEESRRFRELSRAQSTCENMSTAYSKLSAAHASFGAERDDKLTSSTLSSAKRHRACRSSP